MEERKYHFFVHAHFQKLFFYGKKSLFSALFPGKLFKQSQIADFIYHPFLHICIQQTVFHKRTHGVFFYKNAIGNMGQISAYDPLPSGMANVGFQNMLSLLAVIRGKHKKLKDFFLQIIGIHFKSHSTFPDGKHFIHRSKTIFHKICEDHLIIKSISVNIRCQSQKFLIFQHVAAHDHAAHQFQKASHVHALIAEFLHNGLCLGKKAAAYKDHQKLLPVHTGVFPVIHLL